MLQRIDRTRENDIFTLRPAAMTSQAIVVGPESPWRRIDAPSERRVARAIDETVRKYSQVASIFNMSIDSDGTFWGAANSGVVANRNGNLQLLKERNGPALPIDSRR
jgi:hypothetical protein